MELVICVNVIVHNPVCISIYWHTASIGALWDSMWCTLLYFYIVCTTLKEGVHRQTYSPLCKYWNWWQNISCIIFQANCMEYSTWWRQLENKCQHNKVTSKQDIMLTLHCSKSVISGIYNVHTMLNVNSAPVFRWLLLITSEILFIPLQFFD
jgi:hypothetical protein